jgi:rhodanese-related sulfurtransferase
MRKLLVISLLAFAAIAGCAKHHDEVAAQAPEVGAVSVDQLDRMLADHSCQAVDANGDLTRQKMGVIPGAVLLVDDSIANLPADKSKGLVFYCANPACGASHEAASKAILAGYANVKVLPEGIAGWVKAGKQTTSI